jgi:chromosomal replication initiation ATPase DnaA
MVEHAAAKAWEIPLEQLYVKRRFRELVEPRQVVFHYRKKYMRHSPRRIDSDTGFNFSDVYHAEKTVDNLLQTNNLFQKQYKYFLEILNTEIEEGTDEEAKKDVI